MVFCKTVCFFIFCIPWVIWPWVKFTMPLYTTLTKPNLTTKNTSIWKCIFIFSVATVVTSRILGGNFFVIHFKFWCPKKLDKSQDKFGLSHGGNICCFLSTMEIFVVSYPQWEYLLFLSQQIFPFSHCLPNYLLCLIL